MAKKEQSQQDRIVKHVIALVGLYGERKYTGSVTFELVFDRGEIVDLVRKNVTRYNPETLGEEKDAGADSDIQGDNGA